MMNDERGGVKSSECFNFTSPIPDLFIFFYFTTAPLDITPSMVTNLSSLPILAARSMPFDSTPRMTAGFRFATTTTVFPGNVAGS